MATYDPPQPMWKRSGASVLDFRPGPSRFGYVVSKILGVKSEVPDINGELVTTFELGKGPALLVIALIVAYFILLGQTGGTVFQRLFSMRRPKSKWGASQAPLKITFLCHFKERMADCCDMIYARGYPKGTSV
jgi:hypothetical protein